MQKKYGRIGQTYRVRAIVRVVKMRAPAVAAAAARRRQRVVPGRK